MKKKSVVLTVIIVLLFESNVFAISNLKLPFLGGETWRCDQGNYDDPLNIINGQETNITHNTNSSMKYAWDFNFGYGNDDLGKTVISPVRYPFFKTDYSPRG